MNVETEELEFPLPCPFTKPYEDDLEYLRHELEWIEQRCLRIGARRRLVAGTDEDPLAEAGSGRLDVAEVLRLKQVATACGRAENRLRREIDQRLRTTTVEQGPVALDRVCEFFRLSAQERVLLLLCLATCLSARFGVLVGLLEPFGSGGGGVTAAGFFGFLELGFEERVRGREMFAAGGRLGRSGLVRVEGGGLDVDAEGLGGVVIGLRGNGGPASDGRRGG